MAVRTELSIPSSPIVTSPQEQTILKENKQNTKQTNRTNKLTTMSVQDPLHNLHNCFWKCLKKLKLPIFIAICHMSIGLELRLKFFCRRVEYRETSIVYLLIQTIEVIEDQSINKNRWTVQNCNYCLCEKWLKWGGGGGFSLFFPKKVINFAQFIEISYSNIVFYFTFWYLLEKATFRTISAVVQK